MIGRAHRFHGHGSLRHVYARGQIVRGQLFALKYLQNEKRKSYRAAIVVSKKVHKSAVVRNRIRRRLYEAVRLSLPQDMRPIDLVIIVYSESVATIPSEELHSQLKTQLQKARLI
jgi:ribonuclease P protein component